MSNLERQRRATEGLDKLRQGDSSFVDELQAEDIASTQSIAYSTLRHQEIVEALAESAVATMQITGGGWANGDTVTYVLERISPN